MAKVITTELQHSGASAANITLDSSKNVTCENNLTVDGTSTFTGNVDFSGSTVTQTTSGDLHYKLISGTAGYSRICFGDSGDDDIGEILYNNANNQLSIKTNAVDRVYVKSDGNAVFKCANSFFEIDKTNTGVILNFTHNASQVGNIGISSSDTSYNTSSDYRLKENVAAISDGITRVKQLKPSKFNWISDDANTLVDGFLAHEVSSVVPNAVTGAKDAVDSDSNPVYQCIDHSKMIPLLTAALKEAITRIEVLEAK